MLKLLCSLALAIVATAQAPACKSSLWVQPEGTSLGQKYPPLLCDCRPDRYPPLPILALGSEQRWVIRLPHCGVLIQ